MKNREEGRKSGKLMKMDSYRLRQMVLGFKAKRRLENENKMRIRGYLTLRLNQGGPTGKMNLCIMSVSPSTVFQIHITHEIFLLRDL